MFIKRLISYLSCLKVTILDNHNVHAAALRRDEPEIFDNLWSGLFGKARKMGGEGVRRGDGSEEG